MLFFGFEQRALLVCRRFICCARGAGSHLARSIRRTVRFPVCRWFVPEVFHALGPFLVSFDNCARRTAHRISDVWLCGFDWGECVSVSNNAASCNYFRAGEMWRGNALEPLETGCVEPTNGAQSLQIWICPLSMCTQIESSIRPSCFEAVALESVRKSRYSLLGEMWNRAQKSAWRQAVSNWTSHRGAAVAIIVQVLLCELLVSFRFPECWLSFGFYADYRTCRAMIIKCSLSYRQNSWHNSRNMRKSALTVEYKIFSTSN